MVATAPPTALGRPRRPPVLDASRTALIPLRPLTIGEILDGGFLIVQRNVRLMLGLPLVVAGATAAYLLAGLGLWVLLGNTTSRTAQIVLSVLMGLLGLLLLQQFLVWMTAVLTRVSLQTVLGEGFAPAVTRATLRSSSHLFWPVLGLSVLQGIAVSTIQSIFSVLYYIVLIGIVFTGADSEGTPQIVAMIAVTVICYAGMVAAYGYLSLTVPALAAESRRSPAWIGTPAKATTVISAFERSIKLVGRKNLPRVTLVYGGLVLIGLGLIMLIAFGVTAMLILFARSINADVMTVLTNPWTLIGLGSASVLIALSALLAYAAAVQTLLYLDLRMRREALDLAMRFDCLPIPQPSAPPVQWMPGPPPFAGPPPFSGPVPGPMPGPPSGQPPMAGPRP